MKRKETLVNLLDAVFQRNAALLMMQVDIESGEFTHAMSGQFEYLYWNDKVIRLSGRHGPALTKLLSSIWGY